MAHSATRGLQRNAGTSRADEAFAIQFSLAVMREDCRGIWCAGCGRVRGQARQIWGFRYPFHFAIGFRQV